MWLAEFCSVRQGKGMANESNDNSTGAEFRAKWCSAIWNFSYPFWLVKEAGSDGSAYSLSLVFNTAVFWPKSVLYCPNALQSRGFSQQKELTPFISLLLVLIDGKAAQESQNIVVAKVPLNYWDTPCCFGHFVSKRRGREGTSCDGREKDPLWKDIEEPVKY